MSVSFSDFREGHEKCQKKLIKQENQFKKQIAILQQKIQFMNEELRDNEQRDNNQKKINQSIMFAYQQTQSIRQQQLSRNIKQLTNKYQNQIKKIKQNNYHQCKKMEEELASMRDKHDQMVLQMDRKNLQHSKNLLQLKRRHQEALSEMTKEKDQQMARKLSVVEEKLKQSQAMANVYKQFVQKRRQLFDDDDESFIQVRDFSVRGSGLKERRNKQNYTNEKSRKSLVKNIQESNRNGHKMLSASKESLKLINTKINRAITQLKVPSSYHQKLNERLKDKGIY